LKEKKKPPVYWHNTVSSTVLALLFSTCDKLLGNVETSDFRNATLAQHLEDPVVQVP
jgi:hypothetical protein